MKRFIVTYFVEHDVIDRSTTATLPKIKKTYTSISTSETDVLPRKDDTVWIDKNQFLDVIRIIRFDSEPQEDGTVPVAVLGSIQTDIDDELEMIHKTIRK